METKLIENCRYTFYVQATGSDKPIKSIRANFKHIHHHTHTINDVNGTYNKNAATLLLYSVDTELDKNTVYSLPFEWIVKVENLENILSSSHSLIPSDILLVIDEYL